MKIYRQLDEPIPKAARAVALGTFDGVHLGHQELLRRLVLAARQMGLIPSVFTFQNHPEQVFAPPGAFAGYLTDEGDRLRTFRELGIEEVFFLPLVPEIYELSAERFLTGWLHERVGAKLIAVGRDARFGAGKTGGVGHLADWCERHDVEPLIVADVLLEGEKVSSTRIREALKKGQVELANRMLAHPYRYNGRVRRGRSLGRHYGFATANIGAMEDRAGVAYGVYASRVRIGQLWYDAISNIGLSPTVDAKATEVRVESHLFDFDRDLYGQDIAVELLAFLRPEYRYENLEAMVPQVEEDKKQARALLRDNGEPLIRAVQNGIPIVELSAPKFSFGRLAVVFRRAAAAGDRSRFSLLMRFLARQNAHLTRPFELESTLAEAYNASLRPIVGLQGDVQILGLELTALVENEENTLLSLVPLLFSCLTRPLLDEEGRLARRELAEVRRDLHEELALRDEDREHRAFMDVLKKVLPEGPAALDGDGDLQELARLEAADIDRAWHTLLHELPVAVYVAGQVSLPLIDLLREQTATLPQQSRPALHTTWPVAPDPQKVTPFVRSLPSRQAIAIDAYRFLTPWYSLDRFAAALYVHLLGGDAHSLLFTEIREKAGLAYQTEALSLSFSGLLLLTSGTAEENLNDVHRLMRQQLKRLNDGSFSADQLQSSRRLLENGWRSEEDSLGTLFVRLMHWHVFGHSPRLADRLAHLDSVSRDQLLEIGQRAEHLLEYSLQNGEERTDV